ncbi:type II toxin-antitoxin system Phd/YefM family antitoxin [Pseudomonas sp. SZMC_28357]|uniref:type II toxin-antitoxin system Phd/YefM family antitoxin n=1 Tax=Pseudomonas sp. SZMC_28357 TaxID=3074380 RepID=UPI002871DE56|nr:type II toxin-antitoxin system Phd/YefM family antitoxin [Pseudomonas sp. SZMC_28357]MDR9751748.1 type II toxin-antitoxin system Phd/YefM family antitoxin [Pseudomonas sp. SZMC_28357]
MIMRITWQVTALAVFDTDDDNERTNGMSALPDRAEQAVSATTMARDFRARLKDVASGDVNHLVIFKDNEPAAVLVGVQAYQALQDELEDLRSELLAIERLPSLDDTVTVSLEEMDSRFSQ